MKILLKILAYFPKKSGIPYTALKNFYTRGADNIGLSTSKKFADYFDITLDYFVYHNYVIQCSKDEFELIKTFRKVNDIRTPLSLRTHNQELLTQPYQWELVLPLTGK